MEYKLRLAKQLRYKNNLIFYTDSLLMTNLPVFSRKPRKPRKENA